MTGSAWRFEPATPERWDDVETVFRDCSYARRCWCAYWYLPNRQFRQGWGEANQAALRQKVASGRVPGLLAYDGERPAAWCAMAPRREHDRLNRSRSLAAVDDREVWSITCFVVRKGYRRRGLMRSLIAAALDHAARLGVRTLEAYPVEPREGAGSSELFMGTAAAFLDNGFTEVARRLPRRPIVRRDLA